MNFHESLHRRDDILPLMAEIRGRVRGSEYLPGAVSADDVCFLHDIIAAARPGRFLEVGVATGLSSSFLGRFLELHGGVSYTGIDVSERFYGDPSQKLGFLIDELLPSPAIDFEIKPGCSVLDLDDLCGAEKFQACFIDANHRHPYPLLDTMLTLPHLSAGAWVLHHDLTLHSRQSPPHGIGPKYVFDLLAHDPTLATDPQGGNTFGFRSSGNLDDYTKIFAEGLLLPWTTREGLKPREVRQIRRKLRQLYPKEILTAFQTACERFGGGAG